MLTPVTCPIAKDAAGLAFSYRILQTRHNSGLCLVKPSVRHMRMSREV